MHRRGRGAEERERLTRGDKRPFLVTCNISSVNRISTSFCHICSLLRIRSFAISASFSHICSLLRTRSFAPGFVGGCVTPKLVRGQPPRGQLLSPGLCWLPLPLLRAPNCILVGKWILYRSHSRHGPICRRPTGRRPTGPFLLITTNAKSKARADHLVFFMDR